MMRLSEIKRDWTFIPLGGATNYWVEPIGAGPSNTIGPKRVLEIGCQLESENEKLKDMDFLCAKAYDLLERASGTKDELGAMAGVWCMQYEDALKKVDDESI